MAQVTADVVCEADADQPVVAPTPMVTVTRSLSTNSSAVALVE
jgi:hypothetical protein